MFTIEKYRLLSQVTSEGEGSSSADELIAYISVLKYSVIKNFGFQLFDWTTKEAIKVLTVARIMSVYEEDKHKAQEMKNSQTTGGIKGSSGMPIQMPIPHR